MKQIIYFSYGMVSYVVFLIVYTYFVLWENNIFVPTGVDTGEASSPTILAIAIDVLLIALFFVPHSMMARKSFKAWWTTIIPPTLERSTYVLISSSLMALWIYFWQPIPFVIYDLTDSWVGTFLMILSFSGFFLAVFCTFLINHFELFGLNQVFHALQEKKQLPYKFVTPLLYQFMRHPLYFSFMIAFWCNPIFSSGHLLFATLATLYTLIGIGYEEKDLKNLFGRTYENYSKETPKLFPSLLKSKAILFIGGLAMISLLAASIIGPIG